MLSYNVATKSSFSIQDCVVVTALNDGSVDVTSSRDRGVKVRYSRNEWAAFVAGVKADEFDLPALP